MGSDLAEPDLDLVSSGCASAEPGCDPVGSGCATADSGLDPASSEFAELGRDPDGCGCAPADPGLAEPDDPGLDLGRRAEDDLSPLGGRGSMVGSGCIAVGTNSVMAGLLSILRFSSSICSSSELLR